MGIKGLRSLLKKEFKNEPFEENVHFSYFENKKIVIDASLYICRFKATFKENFEDAFINMITSFLKNKIIPIFIFDGTAPIEKSKERKARSDRKAAHTSHIVKLENDLQIYSNTKHISDDLWTVNNSVFQSKLIPNQQFFSLAKVKAHITKLRSNVLDVTTHDFAALRNILKTYEIPQYTAEGEAEMLCSVFVKNGLADAVLTKDTDVLASGAHTMLCDMNLRTHEFTMIKLEKLLDKLNLEYESLLDLCIMCGTDFNNNIPNVGPVRSLAYIQKYKTLETVSEHIDTTCLSYHRTRDIFKNSEKCPTDLSSIEQVNVNALFEKVKK